MRLLQWLGEKSHFFTLAYPAASPILIFIPVVAIWKKRREVSAALHIMALPLLPWPWNYLLAPYATLFLFTIPTSMYGPYLAAAYVLAGLVWGPMNPLLIPLAVAGGWWAFWKARHLASPVEVRAEPPTLVAGEVGVWVVEVRACCKFRIRPGQLSFAEVEGYKVLSTEARAAFKIGGVYAPEVEVELLDPLDVVRTVVKARHPPVTVVPRARAALEQLAAGLEPAEYKGLREYVPGDRPKLIYWKKSTALERLVVKVFSTVGSYGAVVLIPYARDGEAADKLAAVAIYSTLAAGAPLYVYDFKTLARVEKAEEVLTAVRVVGNFLTRPSECFTEPRGLPPDVLILADEPYAACFKNFQVATP